MSSENENLTNFQVLPMQMTTAQVHEPNEDIKTVVPFRNESMSSSFLNWQMLAAILVVVTILGATIFASGQEDIPASDRPISSRLLDWTSYWSSPNTSEGGVEVSQPHKLDQLMEYSFFVLWAYCGSELVTHLLFNNAYNLV